MKIMLSIAKPIRNLAFLIFVLSLTSLHQFCYGQCPSGYVPKPTQNCAGAIPLCGLRYTYPTGNICGPGTIPGEIPSGSCLGSDEKNTTWYVFTVRVSGQLRFVINPLDAIGNSNGNTDYDWAVFKLPAGQINTLATCALLNNNLSWQFSCNFSGASGPTGMIDTTGTTATNTQGAGGTRFNQTRPVLAGETYVLAVDNFSGGNLVGYTIRFSQPGSNGVADITPLPDPPRLSTVNTSFGCGNNYLTFNFTKPVLCRDIRKNAFMVSRLNSQGQRVNVPLDTAFGSNCTDGQSQSFNLGFTPLNPDTTYMISLADTIYDICGNYIFADTAYFRILPFLSLKALPTDSVCRSQQSTTINSETGIIGDYIWNWKVISGDFGSLPIDNIANIQVLPSVTSVYRLIATLPNGCRDSSEITIKVLPLPRPQLGRDTALCYKGRTDLKIRAISNNTVPIRVYRWETRNSRIFGGSANGEFVFTPDSSDQIYVTGISASGCFARDTINVALGDSIQAKFSTDTLSGAAPLRVLFTNRSYGRRVRYEWDFGDGSVSVASASSAAQPVHIYTKQGNFNAILSVFDTTAGVLGCVSRDTVKIEVINVLLPNIITPNGDNKNDTFIFRGISQNLDLQIFNRWGKEIFKQSAYKNDWGAEDVPSGQYYYLLIDKNTSQKYTGWIQVLK